MSKIYDFRDGGFTYHDTNEWKDAKRKTWWHGVLEVLKDVDLWCLIATFLLVLGPVFLVAFWG